MIGLLDYFVMIHLFHGENITASRRELTLLREGHAKDEIVVFDGKKVTPTELIQATESTSLFTLRRLVIVENLFSKRATLKSKELDTFAEILKKFPKDTEIVFWEEKELGKTLLGLFSKETDIALFRPDKMLFTFIESIRPNTTKTLISLFDKSLQKDAAEMIFVMLVRQLRFLIIAHEVGTKIPELAPWQAKKFATQAQYFSYPQLITLYEHLLEIDVKIKTGATPFTLAEEIRLFLVKI